MAVLVALLVLAGFAVISGRDGASLGKSGSLASEPQVVYGNGAYVGHIDDSNADEKARAFLDGNAAVLGVDVDGLKLEKVEEDEPLYPNGSDTYVLSYRQEHRGVPVYNGYVNMFISNNSVVSVQNSYYEGLDVSVLPRLDKEDAVKIAKEKFNINVTGFPIAPVFPASLIVFPEKAASGVTPHLAYMVELPLAAEPLAMWTVFVDASTGEILHKFNRIVYGDKVQGRVKGNVFQNSPAELQSPAEFQHESVFATSNSNHAFHSERGISIIETASQIDLGQASSAFLSFDVRHDLEELGIGALLVRASGAGNESTDVLASYRGLGASWTGQQFDISRYAGKNVSVIFALLSPVDSVKPGFFVDNILVEMNNGVVFSDDVESGVSKWTANSLVSSGFEVALDDLNAKSSVTMKGDYRIDELEGDITLFSSLSGPFANVNSLPFIGIDTFGQDALHTANFPVDEVNSHDWNWAGSDVSYKKEESNAFYHVNLVHDYFTRGSPFNFSELDFPMPVNVEVLSDFGLSCNAFATGLSVNFFGPGNGCDSTALGSDIIYHEYTHNVVSRAYLTVPTEVAEIPAMNEGWADYFAATITDDPSIGEGVFPQPIRFLNNTRRLQDGLTGEPHDDSLPFSGAMWDLREALGKDRSDSLIIRAIKLQPRFFSEFLDDLLIVDDDNGALSDGTPHIREICQSFEENHGIESDLCPVAEVKK